jgi:hypothetical protein
MIPTSAETCPAYVIPTSCAVDAIASNTGRLNPGWSLRKSYPAALWARTRRAAVSVSGAEFPLSDGAPTRIVGPSSSPDAVCRRRSSWFGAPSMPRIVVMPLAT